MSEKKGKSKNPLHGIRDGFRALLNDKEPDQQSPTPKQHSARPRSPWKRKPFATATGVPSPSTETETPTPTLQLDLQSPVAVQSPTGFGRGESSQPRPSDAASGLNTAQPTYAITEPEGKQVQQAPAVLHGDPTHAGLGSRTSATPQDHSHCSPSPVCNQATSPDSHQTLVPSLAAVEPPAQSEDELRDNILGAIEGLKAVQVQLELKKWSYKDRNGVDVDVAKRIGKILKSAQEYAKIVDVAIQHNPAITALVWAGVRFILMTAVNSFQLLEALEVTIATVVAKMAACEFYSHIYKDLQDRVKLGTRVALGEHLGSALRALYIAVQTFLDKAKNHFDPKTATKKIANIFVPFSTAVQPYIQDILDKEKIVMECANMASMDRTMDAAAKMQTLETVITGIKQAMAPLSRVDEILEATRESVTILKEVREDVRMLVQKKLYPCQFEILESARSLDPELQRLKRNYLTDSEESDAFEADLYVDTQGMLHPNAPESECFDLAQRLHDQFLVETSLYKVCLIQGTGGSGKSTFNHYLARQLWHEFDKNQTGEQATTAAIPVFISLASLHDPTDRRQDLILKFFKGQQWGQELIQAARENLRFVFILDGYDEIESRDCNFYMDNKLGTWKAKVIITSRPEYLDPGYHSKFYPSRDQTRLLEFWIAPFSPTSIDLYIDKYVKAHKQTTVEFYKDLVLQPEIQTMLSNPFLLRMFMYVRPTQASAQGPLKVATLYEEFLQNWYTRAQTRLDTVQLPEAQRRIFSNLCSQGFAQRLQIFCQQLALGLYTHKLLEATYNPIFDDPDIGGDSPLQTASESLWRNFLTGVDDKVRLLRFSAPLLRNQHSYRFLHKSLRDYLVAQSLWRDHPALNTGSPNARINKFHIVDDPGVIDFVVEQTEADEELQQHLLTYIELSKTDSSVSQAATNAITILIRAGMRFANADLRGIRIPGADLSTGWFAKAKLQNAQLDRVQLRGAWLRGADLTGAQMQGAWFCEKPRLSLENVRPVAYWYSPAGYMLVASTDTEKLGMPGSLTQISIWLVTEHEQRLAHTLPSIESYMHRMTVASAFSPDGTLFACGIMTGHIWIWPLTSEGRGVALAHNGPWVQCLVFSPDGSLLVSVTLHGALELWSVADQRSLYTSDLVSHNSSHNSYPAIYVDASVAFSPDGKLLVYIDTNGQIALFSVEEMQLLNTVEGHSGFVSCKPSTCVAYSPDGLLLALGGKDMNVTLWSTAQNHIIHTFHNTALVRRVIFSPDSRMLATVSKDGTLQLWSVVGHHLVATLGRTWPQGVAGIPAFSHDNQVLVFTAGRSTIRQLDLHNINIAYQLNRGLGRRINSAPIQRCGLAFSANSVLISAHNGAIRVWSIVPAHTWRGVSNTDKSASESFGLEMSPDQLVESDPDSNLEVMLLETHTISYHGRALYGLSFSSDGKLLASFTCDPMNPSNTTIQFSVVPGRDDVSRFSSNTAIYCWALSHNNSLLACGHSAGNVAIWSVSENQRVATLIPPHAGWLLHSLAFSPQDKLLAAATRNAVYLWSVIEQEHVHTFEVGMDNFGELVFSPDGGFLALATTDYTINLLQVSTVPDSNIHQFRGHTNAVTQLAFQPDGCLLFSGSEDATVRVWSMAMKSTECVAHIDTPSPVNAFAWGTMYGRDVFAIGMQDSLLQLWRVKKKAGYTADSPSIELYCEWSSRQDHLELAETRIEGITGLTSTNVRLMKQRGAIGEPAKEDEQVTELPEES